MVAKNVVIAGLESASTNSNVATRRSFSFRTGTEKWKRLVFLPTWLSVFPSQHFSISIHPRNENGMETQREIHMLRCVMAYCFGIHRFSSPGVIVKDRGHFTRGGASPHCILIILDAVFALARQHCIYEKFSEYSKERKSVVIVRLRSRYNSRSIMRLTWDNNRSPSRSQAQVLNGKEWRVSRYHRKSRELVGLTDVQLLTENQGRIISFILPERMHALLAKLPQFFRGRS